MIGITYICNNIAPSHSRSFLTDIKVPVLSARIMEVSVQMIVTQDDRGPSPGACNFPIFAAFFSLGTMSRMCP